MAILGVEPLPVGWRFNDPYRPIKRVCKGFVENQIYDHVGSFAIAAALGNGRFGLPGGFSGGSNGWAADISFGRVDASAEHFSAEILGSFVRAPSAKN